MSQYLQKMQKVNTDQAHFQRSEHWHAGEGLDASMRHGFMEDMRIQAELGVTRLFEGVRFVTRWLVGNYHPPHTSLTEERPRRRSHSESEANVRTSPEEVSPHNASINV